MIVELFSPLFVFKNQYRLSLKLVSKGSGETDNIQNLGQGLVFKGTAEPEVFEFFRSENKFHIILPFQFDSQVA